MTFNQRYWNAQPKPVRDMRNLSGAALENAARNLAAVGYKIDVPIMVWGFDPLATMVQRQIDGYTWVPSGLQDSIPIGPGLTFPGRPIYDPENPPEGSIKVSTDPADYPPASDMVVTVNPLGQIRQGSPLAGQPREGIQSTWNLRSIPSEDSQLWSVYKVDSKVGSTAEPTPATPVLPDGAQFEKQPQYTAYGWYPLWVRVV